MRGSGAGRASAKLVRIWLPCQGWGVTSCAAAPYPPALCVCTICSRQVTYNNITGSLTLAGEGNTGLFLPAGTPCLPAHQLRLLLLRNARPAGFVPTLCALPRSSPSLPCRPWHASPALHAGVLDSQLVGEGAVVHTIDSVLLPFNPSPASPTPAPVPAPAPVETQPASGAAASLASLAALAASALAAVLLM